MPLGLWISEHSSPVTKGLKGVNLQEEGVALDHGFRGCSIVIGYARQNIMAGGTR
jgi:hypothetical protein